MSNVLYGRVLSVDTRNLGEPATADATIGATSLSVADAATFDEIGGLVTVNGEQLAYTAIDADLNTITLADPLVTAVAEQDLVEVYPETPVKIALIDMGDNSDPLPATVPHSLKDKLTDGTRDADTGETVALEQRGTYEYLVADLSAEPVVVQSLDYTEGEEGIGLSETVAQFQDAQVTGEIGAAVVSADQVLLAGEDLGNVLAEAPRGTQLLVSKGGASEIHAGNTSGTTALRLFRLAYGAVEVGRLYEINYTGLLQGSVSADVFDIKIYYTLDGSDPTTASPLMPFSFHRQGVIGTNASVTVNKTWSWPCTTAGNLQMAMVITRVSGTGVAYMFLTLEGYGFQWTVKDAGLSATATDPAALSQTAKQDGSGSDNPPISTKTLSWTSTHVENFTGLSAVNGSASFTDNGTADIGWNADFGSPQSGDRPDFAILHFNYADIVSKLSTATSIDKVELKFTTKTRAASSGLDVSIFAHKYTSFPWSMALDMSGEISAGRIVLAQGTRNDSVPGATVTATLNTAVGTNLKAGTYKGLGLTTTVYTTAGVGQVYAYPSSLRPVLSITFKSPA